MPSTISTTAPSLNLSIDAVTADSIYVYVDMTDAKPGLQNFTLQVDQPAGGLQMRRQVVAFLCRQHVRRGVERNVGKDFFHDRVQPPRPDILGAGVHVFREGRDFPQAVIQLEFSEAPQESITIQQANEAEEAAVPSE